MKVTNTSITDKELAEVLSQAGMPDKQIKAFLTECCGKECCPEKVRILRSARRTLLDSIHREQALLDRLDYVIWCADCGTPTKRKVTVCIVDIAVYMLIFVFLIINGICFFDERYIPIFYPFSSLLVICRLTFLTLSAIIIEVNIAKHRNDTKMDIRKITPLLIGFEEVLKCA